MAAAIPQEGIEAYMKAEALKVQDGNAWWYLQKRIGPEWYLPALCVSMGVLTALFWDIPSLRFGTPALAPFVGAVLQAGIISGIVFPGTQLIVAANVVPPAEWTRHSFAQFNAQYGGRHYISAEVRRLRARNYEVEFEVAVLERQGNGPYGFVLFQVMEDAEEKSAKDGGTPVLILSGTGGRMSFTETYMPATSF